ncbi:MAG: oligosaccharide flippase family protein [Bacteroidota bacterium]
MLGRFDGHTRELLSGTAAAFVLKVAGAALSFGVNLLLARSLGVVGSGEYFLALSVVTLAATAGRVGMDLALVRFVAARFAEGDWSGLRGYERRGMQIALVALGLATAGTIAFAPGLGQLFGMEDGAGLIRLMSLSIMPFGLVWVYAGLLRGVKRFSASQFVQNVIVPLLLLPLLVGLTGPFAVQGAVGAYVGAALGGSLVGLYLWRRGLPQDGDHNAREALPPAQTLLESGWPLFWVRIATSVLHWFPTFALGIWATSADVGVFNIALRTALLTGFVLLATNTVAAPKFAEVYQLRDAAGMSQIARQAALLTSLVALAPLVAFMVVPTWVLGFFGDGFAEGAASLQVMAFGYFVSSLVGPVGHLLAMAGYEPLLRNIMGVSTAVAVVCCLMLVPTWGVLGAGIATAVGLVLQNLMAAWMAYRLFRINVLFFLPATTPRLP